MTLLDSLLDPHPEDPAVVDGVRIPVVKAAVTFLFYSIRPKHGVPLRKLDSALLHQEVKQLISFSNIKVICAFGLLDLALIHGQRLLAPHDFSSGHFLIIVRVFHLIGLLQELIVDISYIVLLVEPGVFLKPVGLVAHQGQLLGQLTQVIELHTKHLFPYGRQHPCNGHVGQLIIWQV
jgi:hypothetical protein